MGDLDNPRDWTIVLTGEFTLPSGGTRCAVVIAEPDGGNIRLKKARAVRWTNRSGREVRLRFQEWTDEDGGAPEAVWPFNAYDGGLHVSPQTGTVRIVSDGSFMGRLAGTGRIVVKYTVAALTAGGAPDDQVLALDPMIVVER
ncbi:MAG: hypothetical protein MUF56_09640 [Solirubrobacteraceae bacterium]|nr:hypothetical protein [Solirubrobacteraceae bacterium]